MHSSRFQQEPKIGNGRPAGQGCGDNKTELRRLRGGALQVAAPRTESEAPLAVALRGDSRDWLGLALEQAERDPLGVALDAAALWEVLRERAVNYLDREQAGRD
jgi:hypothetical protein